MSLLIAWPTGAGIVCSVSSCSYSFCFLFAAKLRKRNEKALGKGGKVGGEGESLNKCSGFGAILFIRAGGCDVF
jgi:hypothetical protein